MATKNDVFPQANSIPLVLKALSLLSSKKTITHNAISSELGIVLRQVDYYINVLQYFDLITSSNELTLKGRFINDPVINENDKMKILLNIMIEKPVFKQIDQLIITDKKVPGVEIIADIIAQHYSYSKSTLLRRASTVKSWFEYYIKHGIYGVIK